MKTVLPGKAKQNVTMLVDDNGTYTDNADISNCFNRFFCNISLNLASKFPDGLLISNPYPDFNQQFHFKSIHVKFTLQELQILKASKATGLDNINARLLKDACDIIAQPLTTIMNKSLETSIVPTTWKQARVCPIYKTDSPLSPSNYRPISIIPVCMKIFERAVQKQLAAYLKKHSILCKAQSGFREQHSTLTATLDVTDYILKNMDNGLYTGAVYLDLKKAFDTVNSDTLLFKLKCLGIENNELRWFQNYITDRNQCVQHATATSEYLPITCGVPQGSILGPLLFTIYVNDLPHVIKHCKIALYADDTILMFASR